MRVLVLGFCFLLVGCTGYQYIAPPHYVPVDLERGKLNLNFSLNYYQLGYTLSDHFSIYTTGYYRNNKGGIIKGTAFTKENGGAYIQTDKLKEFDLGVTYYKKSSNFFSYEVISGIGHGSVGYSNLQDLLPDYQFSFDANKLSIYIQSDLSFRMEKYFEVSVFSRLNKSRYYDINKNLNLGPKSEPEKYDNYFNNRKIGQLLFVEPGFQFRVGFENIKLHCIFSKVFDLKNTGIQYRQNNLYLGLSMRFNLTKEQ